MQVHDDLAALFSRNLSLSPSSAPQPPPIAIEEPKITYISQHYHHSAHATAAAAAARVTASQPDPQQRPASEPPHPERMAVEIVLRDNGVDPSALSVAQLQLFMTADAPQQQRLVELWRICPPTRSDNIADANNPALAWAGTSIEQEELRARLRFERKLQEHQQQQPPVMSLDGTPVLSSPVQGPDGRWMHSGMAHYMEPYMQSGYEALARRDYDEDAARQLQHHYVPSKDPVYGMVHGWPGQKQAMENQYGAFEQSRDVMEY